MCLITLAVDQDADYPLIIMANRDEFFRRPTASAAYWQEHKHILAGRDKEKGGTWFGVNRSGHFAAVTNVDGRAAPAPSAPSRGLLVAEYLATANDALAYLQQVKHQQEKYAGFNLIAGNMTAVYVLGIHSNQVQKLTGGIHAMGNSDLHSEWPKARRSKQLMRALLHSKQALKAEDLFAILQDSQTPDDAELVDVRMDARWKRKLASIFVRAGEYGTRSSTVLLFHRDGQYQFYERSYDNQAEVIADVSFVADQEWMDGFCSA